MNSFESGGELGSQAAGSPESVTPSTAKIEQTLEGATDNGAVEQAVETEMEASGTAPEVEAAGPSYVEVEQVVKAEDAVALEQARREVEAAFGGGALPAQAWEEAVPKVNQETLDREAVEELGPELPMADALEADQGETALDTNGVEEFESMEEDQEKDEMDLLFEDMLGEAAEYMDPADRDKIMEAYPVVKKMITEALVAFQKHPEDILLESMEEQERSGRDWKKEVRKAVGKVGGSLFMAGLEFFMALVEAAADTVRKAALLEKEEKQQSKEKDKKEKTEQEKEAERKELLKKILKALREKREERDRKERQAEEDKKRAQEKQPVAETLVQEAEGGQVENRQA